MKIEVVITGIFYGTSKAGKSYRRLYLEDCDNSSTNNLNGRRTYSTFAPVDKSFSVGDVIEIIIHKGEAIVIA